MGVSRLTDAQVRKAAPAARDYKLSDGGGMFVLVRPTGGKLWRLKYRLDGKEKMLSFGAYPEVTLADARERREAAKALLKRGEDPAIEKRKAAAVKRTSRSHTFETLAREWFELNKGRWTPVHADDVLTSLTRDVFPSLGSFPIGSIDVPVLLATLQKVEDRGSVETAKRLRQRVAAVFGYAIARNVVTHNPAANLGPALKPKPKARRQPALVDLAQLRELLAKAEESGASPITLLASRLLALTAVRPGVVRGAEWGEFRGINWDGKIGYGSEKSASITVGGFSDQAIWHIPAERMKLTLDRKDETGFDHVVPLAPAAVEVLRAVHRLTGRGELVFPGQRHAHIPLSENAIGYLYNRVGWHGRHVPHGWRAAFSTIMNERAKAAGRDGDRQVIDLMLAHVPANKVESAYNRGEFMPRRREIAEEWAGLLTDGLLPAGDLLTVARRTTHL